MNAENSLRPDEEDPWFYIDGDKKQTGPVTKEHLIGLIKSGAITDNQLVRSGYYIHWQPASKTPELFTLHKQQHSAANSDPASKEASGAPDIGQTRTSPNSLKNGTSLKKSVRTKKTPVKWNGVTSREKPMPLMRNSTDPFILVTALGVFLFALWLL